MSRLKSVLNISLYFILQILFSVLFVLGFGILKIYADLNSLYTVGLIMSLVLFIIIIINYQSLKNKVLPELKDPKSYLYGLVGYGIGFGLNIGYAIFLTILKIVFKIDINEAANQSAVTDLMKGSNPFFILLMIGIIIPILEEIIFRYNIFNIFTKDIKVNKVWPYLLGSIIFASIHMPEFYTSFSLNNALNFIQYLILAGNICFFYYISNHNLVTTSIIHILNNSVSVIIFILATTFGLL